MLPADLAKFSSEELRSWTFQQDDESISTLFDTIWQEIRSSHLYSGGPRSERTLAILKLAELAANIAELRGGLKLTAESSVMLGYVLNANEQYQASLPHYRRGLAGLDELGEFARTARLRLGFIAALFKAGDYDGALAVAAVAEKWMKENNDEVGFARLCHNVANMYHRLDQHHEAIRYHGMAVETLEKTGDQQALAQSYLSIGNSLMKVDRCEEADNMYDRAEKISLAAGLMELWAQALYSRAALKYVRGLYSDALQGFSQVRAHFERSGSVRHYALCDLDEAEIYLELNLSQDAATLASRAVQQFKTIGMRYEETKALAFYGVALFQLGRYSEALDAFFESQKMFDAEGNSYWTALLDLYRAEVHLSLHRYWEAHSHATQAKTRFDEIEIPSKRLLALVMLGRIALSLGNPTAAETYVKEIVELTARTNAPPMLFPYYVLRADVAAKQQRWAEAEEFYELAAQDLETHQTRLHHDDLRVTFFKGKNRAYEALVWIKLTANGEQAVQQAYSWCERAKSRGLIELLSHHLPAVHGNAEQSLLAKINRLREELNMQYARSQPEKRAAQSQAEYETIALKENELSRTLREVSLTDPEYASLQQVTAANVDDIQAMLPQDTSIIEYFIAQDEVIAFVIAGDRIQAFRHLCPASRVAGLWERLAFQLEKFGLGKQFLSHHEQQILRATQHHLNELYQNLMAPLIDEIRTSRLVIIPHGILHYLPFHAMFDGQAYLMDQFEISYAPSASVFKYCLDKEDITGGHPLLIAVADEAAPCVETEVRAIAQMFPTARVLLNSEAPRSVFGEAATRNSFLHIATHALFRQDNPMFSGFKLADGWMTALDLFSTTCEANLVTLSGCKSGMNQVSGSDDLVGLMRGFLYAGARSLMVSLWNVDDEATARLMTRFYDRWQAGDRKAMALTNAMKSIRAENPNPFYWAPFLLTGRV